MSVFLPCVSTVHILSLCAVALSKPRVKIYAAVILFGFSFNKEKKNKKKQPRNPPETPALLSRRTLMACDIQTALEEIIMKSSWRRRSNNNKKKKIQL